LITGTGAGFN